MLVEDLNSLAIITPLTLRGGASMFLAEAKGLTQSGEVLDPIKYKLPSGCGGDPRCQRFYTWSISTITQSYLTTNRQVAIGLFLLRMIETK